MHGRLIVDYSKDLNQPVGYMGPARWQSKFRYAIDLKRRLFFDLGWQNAKPMKFVQQTNARIWFSKNDQGFERYSLKSDQFYSRNEVGNWLIEIVTGKCRRAPFSGIPALERQTD